jgi:CBS domain-containing protein
MGGDTMENNKTTNRNGSSDVGRYQGDEQSQQPDPTGAARFNEPGNITVRTGARGPSDDTNRNSESRFRRLSRSDNSSGERDRNWSGRDTLRGLSDGQFGGGAYRDPERDEFDAQRMDDEGAAQDNRRWRNEGDFGPSPSDRDRSRSYRTDSYQQRGDFRGAEHDLRRYQQRQDSYRPQQDEGRDRARDDRSRSGSSWWQNEASTVTDVMTRDVKTVGPEATIREIVDIMRREDVGVVPIVGDGGRLHGLVTDRDIVLRGLADGKAIDQLRAKDVATTDIEVVSSRDSLSDVIHLMGRQQIRRVPVVGEGDRLVGIVSLADIANRADQDEELQKAFEKISGRRSFWSRIWR